jgi:hypothetical protein
MRQTCNIESVASNGSRTPVVSSLICTPPYPADRQARERAGQATEARLLQVFTEIPGSEIKSSMRLLVGAEDYRIFAVTPWPAITPEFYEVLVEC